MDPPANNDDYYDEIEGQTQALLYSGTVTSDNNIVNHHEEHSRRCILPSAVRVAVPIIGLVLVGAGVLAAFGMFIKAALVAAIGILLYFLRPRQVDDDESIARRTPRDQTITPLITPYQMSRSEMERRLIPHENMMEGYCEICLAEITIFSNRDIVRSPNPACSHVFHKQCILNWLTESPTCPCCRELYLPVMEIVEEGIPVSGQEEFMDEYVESAMPSEWHVDIFNYDANAMLPSLLDSDGGEYWA